MFDEDVTFGESNDKEYFEDKVIEFEDVQTEVYENGDVSNDKDLFNRNLAAKEFIYHDDLNKKA